MKKIIKAREVQRKSTRKKEEEVFLPDFERNLFTFDVGSERLGKWLQFSQLKHEIVALNRTVFGKYGSLLEDHEKRLQQMELRLVRPHAEEFTTDIFSNVVSETLLLKKHYNEIHKRLESFVKIKDLLSECIAKMTKVDIYRRRSLIIIFDAIKHAYSEDLSEKQVEILAGLIMVVTAPSAINKDQFRNIYRSLIVCGFRILPEPKNVVSK